MEIPVSIQFPDFLTNPSSYQKVQEFWKETLKQYLPKGEEAWQPFYNNPILDGNPIFSAWLPQQQKLVRIIQFLPEPGDLLFSSWIDQWQGDFPKHITQQPPGKPPIPELVLELALTPETQQLAKTMMHLWIYLDQPPKEIRNFLIEEAPITK